MSEKANAVGRPLSGDADAFAPARQADADHWRGEVTNELRHIGDTLCELGRQVAELRAGLAGEMAAHRDYHTRNEPRWGPGAWCRAHPLRLALLAAATAATLAAGRAPDIVALARSLAAALK